MKRLLEVLFALLNDRAVVVVMFIAYCAVFWFGLVCLVLAVANG
jgi:uncharacterized membrane protein